VIDSIYYSHPFTKKGFYTNYFHIDVNSGLNPIDKINYERSFHKNCNERCITYLKFRSVPLNYVEAISELNEHAIKSDGNYFGFNYSLHIYVWIVEIKVHMIFAVNVVVLILKE